MRQNIGTVAVIQIGLFLSATLAAIIGGAWNSVLNVNYNYHATLAEAKSSMLGTGKTTTQFDTLQKSLLALKQSRLKFAIVVSVIGLVIMILWTLFVQRLDPNLVSVLEKQFLPSSTN
jgi:hypothetical protein